MIANETTLYKRPNDTEIYRYTLGRHVRTGFKNE